jgi:uncharacterized protein (DUF2384 family)
MVGANEGWVSSYDLKSGAKREAKRARPGRAPDAKLISHGPLPATSFMNRAGLVDIALVADFFRMSKGQLAETAGLPAATLSKTDRREGPKAQSRITEMLEIISRIQDWAGGEAQAMAWYRSQPIPALDGRTPEALVKSGRAAAVRDYLDHLTLGGFA